MELQPMKQSNDVESVESVENVENVEKIEKLEDFPPVTQDKSGGDVVPRGIKGIKGSNRKTLKELGITGQKRHSNYFITINTNQVFTGLEEGFEEYKQRFKNVIREVFSLANIPNFIKVNREGEHFGYPFINRVEVQAAYELGPKKSTLHCHLLLKIAHYTNVSIDNPAIRDMICPRMGLKNIHIDTRLFRGANDTLEDYIRKVG
jgi:ribosomal protein L30/L7E